MTIQAKANAEPKSLGERVDDFFQRFARATSIITGKPIAFVVALAILIVWSLTGPVFHYSDTWQLVINTGTSLVTFLMVFLIQESQNHDTRALQVKLSELIIAVHGAANSTAAAEDLSDKELEALHKHLQQRAKETEARIARRHAKRQSQEQSK
jgi:low affinity Fe/Cu permease